MNGSPAQANHKGFNVWGQMFRAVCSNSANGDHALRSGSEDHPPEVPILRGLTSNTPVAMMQLYRTKNGDGWTVMIIAPNG